MTGMHRVIGAAAALGLGCTTGRTGAPATTPVYPARSCPRGFDGSFVQLGQRELAYDQAAWRRALSLLRAVGVDLVVVQFTGDEYGPYDGRAGRAPVRALIAAAAAMNMKVFLGLDRDPSWPAAAAATRPAPPLGDRRRARALAALCTASPACAGWYIPQEIDDATWSRPERQRILRAHLARTAAALRRLAPGRPIAIAPFFTGALEPGDHARFWDGLLADGSVDIVMLQDGVGSGRGTAEMAGGYLAALRPLAGARGVELWSVVELFRQVHGAPLDSRPFAAVPMHPATLRESLSAERAVAGRMVAFSVLDYMDPARGGAARLLYDDYASDCRIACSNPGWKTRCR